MIENVAVLHPVVLDPPFITFSLSVLEKLETSRSRTNIKVIYIRIYEGANLNKYLVSNLVIYLVFSNINV